MVLEVLAHYEAIVFCRLGITWLFFGYYSKNSFPAQTAVSTNEEMDSL